MDSRQYEQQQLDHLRQVLAAAGIQEYKKCVLGADCTRYRVTLPNGQVVTVPTGFDYFQD